MNKKLIVALAGLLKQDQQVIEDALLKEDGDDSIIKGFTTKYNPLAADELSRLIENSNKKYFDERLTEADFDINHVPKKLSDKIYGAAYEAKEKKIAKEYGIEHYKNFDDLLKQVTQQSGGNGTDQATKQQIETLKANIQKLEKEKEDDINDLKKSYDSEFISRDFDSALASIPFDYEGAALEKQKKLLKSEFFTEYGMERKGNVTVVLNKENKPMVNNLGDPESIANVVKKLASDYEFKIKEKDQGGRGAESSQTTVSLKGKTFDEVVQSRGLKPLTDEADKAFIEWQAANK